MKLKRLHILRMPGFEQHDLLLQDLDEGMNIVLGPNASGKTTICRAIQALLWPQTYAGGGYLHLRGEWDEQGSSLVLERKGDQVICQRDGLVAALPTLPRPDLCGCFVVTVDDLFLRSSGTDSQLAAEVQKHLAGGFDLNAARSYDLLRRSPRKGQIAAREHAAARRTVKRIKSEYSSLQRQEAALGELQGQLDRAIEAEKEIELLAAAEQMANCDEQISALEAQLAAFPQSMAHLLGNELEVLHELQTSLDSQQTNLQQAAAERDRAQQVLDSLQLPDNQTPAAILEQCEACLEEIRRHHAETTRLSRELAKLRHGQAGVGGDPQLSVQRDDLEQMQLLHRRTAELESRLDPLRARATLLQRNTADGDSKQNSAALERGIALLRQWLRSGEEAGGTHRMLLFLAIVMLTALAGLLGILVDRLWFVAELIPLGVIAVLMHRRIKQGRATPGDLAAEYGSLSLEQPTYWRETEVQGLLLELEHRWGRVQLVRARQLELEEVLQELAGLEPESKQVDQQRTELARKLGVAPDTSSLSLVVLGSEIMRRQEAAEEASGLQHAVEESRQTCEVKLSTLSSLLTGFGLADCQSLEEAVAAVQIVREKVREFGAATQQAQTAKHTLANADTLVKRYQQQVTRLFEKLELPVDDEAGLAQLAAALPEYRERTEKQRALQLQRQVPQRLLQERAAQLLELPPAAIARRQEELQQQAHRRDQLVEQITTIRTRTEAARHKHDLEMALLKEDQTRARLEEIFEQELRAVSASFLLQTAEAEHQLKSQPAVFRRAAELFNTFTRGRYELLPADPGDEAPGFRARDVTGRQILQYSQLSRGTVMQLILAARIAFAEELEEGCRIPLLLDEVLSNSDPVRFESVGQAVLELAAQGRQVLYFSCQPGDGEAWQMLARESAAAIPRIVKISHHDAEYTAASVTLSISALQAQSVPAPAEMDYSQYCAHLGIAPPDPTTPAAAAHIAHFLDDPQQLYAVLQAGIVTFGQLAGLMQYGAHSAYLDGAAWSRACARAAVLDAFAVAWSVGRGPRLTPEILQEICSGSKLLEAIIEAARAVDWYGKTLISVLDPAGGKQVKGLRRLTFEQLVQDLSERGYLPPEEPLSKDDMRIRVLAAVNDQVHQEHLRAAEVRAYFDYLWEHAAGADQAAAALAGAA